MYHAVEAPTTAPSLSPSPAVVLDADNVTSNLTLSCTVAGEGRFRWQWTDAGGNSLNPEVTFSDTTRTNTALFTRIKSGNTFRCVATYDPAIPGASFGMSASQEISVRFPRKESLLITVLMKLNNYHCRRIGGCGSYHEIC